MTNSFVGDHQDALVDVDEVAVVDHQVDYK